jgi:hypothetical protein
MDNYLSHQEAKDSAKSLFRVLNSVMDEAEDGFVEIKEIEPCIKELKLFVYELLINGVRPKYNKGE